MNRTFEGFIEVPTSAFVEGGDMQMSALPPIAFYTVNRDMLVCIRDANKPLSPQALSQYQTVWIREFDAHKLGKTLDSILRNPKLAASLCQESRMKLVARATASATEELFENPSAESLSRSAHVVGSFVKVLMQDPQASRFLLKLSAQSPRQVRHAIATATQCVLLARMAGVESEQELQDAGMAGLLHDIGRTQLPEALADKDERDCSGAELADLKKHPQLGQQLVQNFPQISGRTQRAILEHHEYIDGSGYPLGKKKENLSLISRILCLCNLFQTLTTETPTRPALSGQQAFEKIRKEYLGKVDADLVKHLAQIISTD